MKRFLTALLVASCWLSVAMPSAAGVLDDLKAQIQQREEEIRQLEAQKKQFEGTVAEKQRAARTLNNEIARLNAAISALAVQEKITEADIGKTTLGIQELSFVITRHAEDIATNQTRIGELMRAFYELTESNGTLFALVAKNANFSDFFNQLDYVDKLQEELMKRLMAVKTAKASAEAEQETLIEKRGDLEELDARLEAEKKTKSGQQQSKNQLLRTTKNQEKQYKILLDETEKKRQEILKDIKELEDKLRRTIDPASIPAFRPGVLEWPVKGIISQGYGATSETGFQNDAYEFHNGIDIAGPLGTPIRAARAGTVKAVGNNSPYAYGKWIAVEHDNNLITLYTHLSVQSVKVGQAVKGAQVIGYMGATGYATGSHLHFTVYAANTFITEQRWFGLLPLGGSINPRNYLP